MLRRHWQFGKGTRSSFQYRGLASNPNRHPEAKRAAGVTSAETGSTSPIMSAHSRNPPKLIEHDLDNGQRSPGFLPLSNPHHHAFGTTGRADSEIGLNPSAHQERGMSKLIYAGVITLAIFGSIGFAAAQRGPGADHPNLTPTQERTVSQGLASSPSQAAPVGVQPQVGNMLPDSLAAQALPSDVSDRVPEAGNCCS